MTDAGDLIRRGADKCDLDLDLVVSLPLPDEDQVWFIEHRSNWQDEGPHYILWRYEELPDDHQETHMLELPQAYAMGLNSLTYVAQLHAIMVDTDGYSPLTDDGSLDLRTVAENFDLSSDLGEGTMPTRDTAKAHNDVIDRLEEGAGVKEDGDDE